MSMNDQNEFPLERQPDVAFASENFALMCLDSNARVAVLYSIGTWHFDTSVWREVLAVAFEDGSLAVAKNFGRGTRGNTVSACLSQYQIVESGKRVHLSFNGPASYRPFDELVKRGLVNTGEPRKLKLDIEFEAVAPMWDMKGQHDDKTGIAGSMHTEQIGSCSGTIAFAARNVQVRGGYAVRDHSRGPRTTEKYERHCWLNGRFESGRCFHTYTMDVDGVSRPAMSHAVVFEGDKPFPAEIKEIEYIRGPGDARKLHRFILSSALGEMRIDVTGVISSVPVSMLEPFDLSPGAMPDVSAGVRNGIVFDEAVEIEWLGTKGVGWSERGARIVPTQ
jgi:hypothetical protein